MESNTAPQNFLPKPSNKYSMGKYLRSLKGLYKQDPKTILNPDLTQKQENIQNFLSKGLKINKLTFARFFLKNGLPYDGLMTTDTVFPNELLIKVPKNLLLSSYNAYLSDLKVIYNENFEIFDDDGDIDENLVLIIFILYEFQKGKNSQYYHLISSLPKDQDIVSLWPESEIQAFEDYRLTRKVLNKLYWIHYEYETVKQVIDKYPHMIKPEIFTFENFAWIYCLMLNRCFGAIIFKYKLMLPFAENLNHECNYMSYDLVKEGNEGDLVKESSDGTENTTKDIKVVVEDDYMTSDVSSEEVESDYEEDFINNDGKEKTAINDLDLETQQKSLKKWFDENFDYYDIFSLIYAYKALNHAKTLKNDDSLDKENLKKKLDRLDLYNKEYLDKLETFSKSYFKKDNYVKYCQSLRPIIYNENPKPKQNLFNKKFEEDNFDSVEFRTGCNEIYEKNSQVYYCYGRRSGLRKSNRYLIYYYGMCIEYNKYGHVCIRADYRKYMEINEDFMDLMRNQEICNNKKFKLKYTKFNIDLINFFKLIFYDFNTHHINSIFCPNDIDLELKAIDSTIDFLKQCNQSKYTMQDNENILYDKKTGYHEYFAAVYRLEKQRIIKLQKDLMEISREILRRIKQGLKLEDTLKIIEKLENQQEFNRNRYLLHDYLKSFAF